MFDLFIAAFALVGLRELWCKRPLYAIWLLVAFIFLLLWPTKWPQYVLTLTFPLSLSVALGVTAVDDVGGYGRFENGSGGSP